MFHAVIFSQFAIENVNFYKYSMCLCGNLLKGLLKESGQYSTLTPDTHTPLGLGLPPPGVGLDTPSQTPQPPPGSGPRHPPVNRMTDRQV